MKRLPFLQSYLCGTTLNATLTVSKNNMFVKPLFVFSGFPWFSVEAPVEIFGLGRSRR